MKKTLMILSLLIFISFLLVQPDKSVFASQQSDQSVKIEGKLINNRVLIPLRAFSEHLDAKVDWDNEKKRAYIYDSNRVISIGLNGTEVTVNGLPTEYLLDVPMTMINNITYVPFSYIGSVMGADVTWNNKVKQATVNYNAKTLLIQAKVDNSVQLPSYPTQNRLNQLYAKVNEAANIKNYAQKRQQLAGYFTNEFINRVIANNGLTLYDKNNANDFNEPMLFYPPTTVYDAVLFQAVTDPEIFERLSGTLTRNIVLKFIDGQWLVTDVQTVVK